ncbi:MAG: DUF6519 domain-containing protein [Pseudomonadota bacterium]|nr:DUF6519 domain-containing protein [Pseudomonadota bacterium]
MKTQISRDSFQPEQRYSGVYLQQGRMILDADWNELSDIEKARLVDALRDAIAGGAPRVGGLKVFADPAGSANIRIQPGALYVEGVPARLDASAPLPVNAQPDYPIQADYSGQNFKLYADVWERSVSALEQSALMDAALHGADTATRSQTMLQVKWCANTLDPLNEVANPCIGTAPLTLKLRLIASSGDTCDPCSSQVKVDERLGNYLFRVEIHDYEPATQWLTLKWSRDNGAEACAVAAMPAGFNQGDWVWEYFDNDTERLLGNHFATNPLKLRGLIKETCATPSGVNEPKTYVRQWDGTIKVKLDSGALSGRDRGVALFAGAVGNQAQGRANFAGGVLKINLERLELELSSSGKRFVPGDYWLAEVREAEDASGDTVLSAAPPRGVRHHYLFLGELGVDKKLVAQNDAFKRRMAFPPLTDIVAADVGFSDHCVGLYAGAANVQQALDNLCAIDADDIAYPLPNCGANEGKSIKDRLKALLDPDSDGKLTVKAALDNLLCQLNATSLPYNVPACASSPSVRELLGLAVGDNNVAPVLDKLLCEFKANDLPLDKSDAALCSDLQAPAVVTVQDALKVLCGKSGGGCAVAATSPEHLGLLLQEFANSSSATDLWVCLKGGSYPLAGVPAISGKRSLRISGEGPESVFISFSGTTLSLGADEVILENCSLTFGNSAGQLAITADTARTQGCHFSRTSGSANGPAMISVGGQGGSACQMSWRDNVLYAQVKSSVGNGSKWGGTAVVGDATVSKAILALGKDELLLDKTAYDTALNEVVTAIMAMTPEKRLAWKTNLEQVGPRATPRAAVVRVVKANSENMTVALGKERLTHSETMVAVEGLVALWVTYKPDTALRLANQKVGGMIEGNQVDGWVLLGNGVDGYSSPATINGVGLEGSIVKSGGEDLRLVANSLSALKANLPGTALNADQALVAQVNGHARITLSGNRFEDAGNAVTASNLVAQGNTWLGNDSDLGYAVVDRAAFTGNLVEDSTQEFSRINATVSEGQLASAGNLLLNVMPMRG